MGHATKAQLNASERARSSRHSSMATLDPGERTQALFTPSLDHAEIFQEDPTAWSGGVNHTPSDDEWSDDDILESDHDIEEITVFREVIQKTHLLQQPVQQPVPVQPSRENAFAVLMQKKTTKDWVEGEKKLKIYTGNSDKRKREIRLDLEKKEEVDSTVRNR